jgi:hypothetical protein
MHSIKQGCGRLTADVVSCDSRRMVKDGGLILKLALRIEGFAWPLSPDTPSYPTPPESPNQRAEACGSVALELQQSPYLFICPDCNRANRVVIALSHEGLLVYAVYNKPFLPERPPGYPQLTVPGAVSFTITCCPESVYAEYLILLTCTTVNMADRFPSIEDIDAG